MRSPITITLLDGLKPKLTPYEVRDTKLPGFMVRVQPSGAVSFIAQIGRAKRVTLGRYPACTLKRAYKLALKALSAAEEGATTSQVKALVHPAIDDPLTLRSFVDRTYRTWLVQNRKSGAAESARLISAFPSLLDKPLSHVSAWAIEQWRTDRLKSGTKPASINRDLNTLKACLRRAVDWGDLAIYPLGTVKPMKVDTRGVVRFLSEEEESALRRALIARDTRRADARASGNAWRLQRRIDELPAYEPDHLTPMVLLSLNTGLRRGELFELRWRDVDFSRRNLTVVGSATKGGHTRYIPLNDEAADVLTKWSRVGSTADALVFPGRAGRKFNTLKTSWSALLNSAGIAQFRWHDLRHTFASKLVQAGVDLNAVRELLGHSDIKMTLRYAHLTPAHLAEAVMKIRPASNVEREEIS